MCDFDAKVINDETEDDAAPHVPPETGGVLALVVPFFGEALFKELVGKDAGLGEAIHPLLDVDLYPSAFVDEVLKVVVVNDFFQG